MSNGRFDLVPTDELWLLFEDLAVTLTERMTGEKSELHARLKGLNELKSIGSADEPIKCRSRIQ